MPDLSRQALEDVTRLSEQIEEILNREPGATITEPTPSDEMRNVVTTHLRQRGRDWVTILAVLAILAGIFNMVLLEYRFRTGPQAALRYPQQQVLSRVLGSERPSASASVPLITRGTKCNDASKAIDVVGQKVWVSVTPAGSSIPDGGSNGTRTPGCHTKEFINAVPEQVLRQTRLLCDELHVSFVTWRLTGRETPVDRAHYAIAVWQSQDVDVYPPPN